MVQGGGAFLSDKSPGMQTYIVCYMRDEFGSYGRDVYR